mgnify:FL=1
MSVQRTCRCARDEHARGMDASAEVSVQGMGVGGCGVWVCKRYGVLRWV